MKYPIAFNPFQFKLTICVVMFMGLVNFSFAERMHVNRYNKMGSFKDISCAAWYPGDTDSVEAQFPGGASAWMKYLVRNLRYPEEGIKKRIEGTVILTFVIDEKGKVKDIETTGPDQGGLRNEAIRLLRQGGKWIPAKVNDKPVRSSKVQVITFMPKG